MNASLRAAAKALARSAGEGLGLGGPDLSRHIDANWEMHLREACAVLDAVLSNIGHDPADTERLGRKAMQQWRAQNQAIPPVDPARALRAARFVLWAIRDEGPR